MVQRFGTVRSTHAILRTFVSDHGLHLAVVVSALFAALLQPPTATGQTLLVAGFDDQDIGCVETGGAAAGQPSTVASMVAQIEPTPMSSQSLGLAELPLPPETEGVDEAPGVYFDFLGGVSVSGGGVLAWTAKLYFRGVRRAIRSNSRRLSARHPPYFTNSFSRLTERSPTVSLRILFGSGARDWEAG